MRNHLTQVGAFPIIKAAQTKENVFKVTTQTCTAVTLNSREININGLVAANIWKVLSAL